MSISFKVSVVHDGDTFDVDEGWTWTTSSGEKHRGQTVRPVGFNAPEKGKPGYQTAKDKLTRLLLGKQVKLTNPVNLSYGRLVCDVYLDGKNLRDYFPEYR